MTIKNVANDTPYDCIQDETSQCGRLLKFNKDLRNLGIGGWSKNIDKLVLSRYVGDPSKVNSFINFFFNSFCSDISNGRENYPIQLLTNLETGDDTVIPDFKYITKNILMQNLIQIDERISQMRVCNCVDR